MDTHNQNSWFPLAATNLNPDNDIKLNEDTYEICVNGDLIGHKTMKSPGEKLSDVDDFLKGQGILGFTASLNGDQYTISAVDSESVRNVLSVYLNNR